MKTNKVFVFRHAENDGPNFLTPKGQKTAREIGKALKERYGISLDIAIICSNEIRAIRTAQHICESFETVRRPKCHEELFSLEAKCDVPGALQVIEGYLEAVETLVIVTHLEMAAVLPQAFGTKFLMAEGFPAHNILHGQGWVIDCERKTCEQFVAAIGAL